MQFKRSITALAAAALVGTLGFASASVLNLDAGTLQQSDNASVTSQTSTVQTHYGYEADDNTVYFVRFSGFDPAAIGETAFVTVRDNGGAVIEHGSFVVAGTTADRLNLSPRPLAQNVGSVEVALVG